MKLGSKINVISPTFAKNLGLWVWRIEIGAQKNDGSSPKTFEIVRASFSIDNKSIRSSFFEETFLIANININIVLIMFFLILSNLQINFLEQKLN